MELIPVIDLLHGRVVRGVKGDRHAYRPIESALCGTSEPTAVARILSDHCATRRLYVADLDALLGAPAQTEALRAVLDALPALELWLDAGFADRSAAERLRLELGSAGARVVPVFASESLGSRAELERCVGAPAGAEPVLSLDRRDGRRLDAAGCWDAPELWPARVIVMTLERVGADAGPDLETLREVQAKKPAARLVGAGGIRDVDDLARADAAGAAAWLVASALHDGRLPAVRP